MSLIYSQFPSPFGYLPMCASRLDYHAVPQMLERYLAPIRDGTCIRYGCFQRTLSFSVRTCATLTSSGSDPASGIDGRDSNPHLAVLETAALPLSYAYICHRRPDLNREASGPS